jgi:hypothetical protein
MNIRSHSGSFLTSCILAMGVLLPDAGSLRGAPDSSQKEARVTQVIREVKLLPSEEKPRPAVLNDKVPEDTAVRTGDDSRSELTFVDLTITRLGANTIFSFNKAGRNVRLNSGAMLLRVPKDSGGARMTTEACSVAITGTTVILEAARSGRNTLSVLEGGARLSLNKYPKESAFVRAGQKLNVPPGASKLPAPEDIDVDQVMKKNPLITDFPALPSRDLIYTSRNNPGSPVIYQGKVVDNQPGPVVTASPLFPSFRPRDSGWPNTPGQTGEKTNKKKAPPNNADETKPDGTSNQAAGNQLVKARGANIKSQTTPTPTPTRKKKKNENDPSTPYGN